jgi:hypothetical protein
MSRKQKVFLGFSEKKKVGSGCGARASREATWQQDREGETAVTGEVGPVGAAI